MAASTNTDKLKKVYDLYTSNGLIKTTDFDTFSKASEDQKKKLYDLGVKQGLFKSTDYGTFSTAWVKKKEQGVQPQQPTGGVSPSGSVPTQPISGSKPSPKYNWKTYNKKTEPEQGILKSIRQAAVEAAAWYGAQGIFEEDGVLNQEDIDGLAELAVKRAQSMKSFEKSFYNPDGTTVNKTFSKSYLNGNILPNIGYADNGYSLNRADQQKVQQRFDQMLSNMKAMTPAESERITENLKKGVYNFKVDIAKRVAVAEKKRNNAPQQEIEATEKFYDNSKIEGAGKMTPQEERLRQDLRMQGKSEEDIKIELEKQRQKVDFKYENWFDQDVLDLLSEQDKKDIQEYVANNPEIKTKYSYYATRSPESQAELITQAIMPRLNQALNGLKIYSDNQMIEKLGQLGELNKVLGVYDFELNLLKKQIENYSPKELSQEQKAQLEIDKSQFQIKDNEYTEAMKGFNVLKQQLTPVFDELGKLKPLAEAGDQVAVKKYNGIYNSNKEAIEMYDAMIPQLEELLNARNLSAQALNKYATTQEDIALFSQYKQSVDKYNQIYEEVFPLYRKQQEIAQQLPKEDIDKIFQLYKEMNSAVSLSNELRRRSQPTVGDLIATSMQTNPLWSFHMATTFPFLQSAGEFTLKGAAGIMRSTSDVLETLTMKPDDYYSGADFAADMIVKGSDLTGESWIRDVMPGYQMKDFYDLNGNFVYSPLSLTVGAFEQLGVVAGAAIGTTMMGGASSNTAIIAPMFFATYDDNKELARQLGYSSRFESMTAGVLFSAIEGISELILPDVKLFQGDAKKQLFMTFLDNYQKGGKAVAIKSIAEAVGKEYGEELMVEFGKVIATAMTNGFGGNVQQYNVSGADLFQTFVFTALASGPLQGIKAVGTSTSSFNNAMKFEMAKDLKSSVDMIESYRRIGKINDVKAEQLKRELNVISAVQGQLPDDLSQAKRVVVSGLYAERSGLEQKMNDPNVTNEVKEGYKSAINKINSRISQVIVADDTEFNDAYNKELEAQTEEVVSEIKKQYPELSAPATTPAAEAAPTTETDRIRTQILDDIFKDSTAQNKADALEQRMNNAEEISMTEINDVLDGLYKQVEMVMDNYFDNEAGKQYAQALLDKIDKIKSYEFATNKETAVITERKAIQTARASLQETASVINLARAPRATATITSEDGTTGTYSIEVGPDGAVTFEQKGAEPIRIGNVNDVNKTASIVETVLNEQGLPQSVSFSITDENGRKHTITVEAGKKLKPQQLLDLAINIRANELGTVDPTDFDTAYQEVTKEVTTVKPAAGKEGVTAKPQERAVQVETAGQVPVQPEAGTRQEMAEGKPQAKPQVTAQAGVEEEIADIERRRKNELEDIQYPSYRAREGDETLNAKVKSLLMEMYGVESLTQEIVDKGPIVDRETYEKLNDEIQQVHKEITSLLTDKVNAKYDAEYTDAVKKGKMTKEQAMQALEEVGRKDSKAYAELAALGATPAPTAQAKPQEVAKEGVKEEVAAPKKQSKADKLNELQNQLIRAKINSRIPNILKALQSVGVKIEIIEDPAEYDRIMRDEYGNNYISAGVYVAESGKIYLNPERMIATGEGVKILYHEATHPILNIIRNTNKPLYDKMVRAMEQAEKASTGKNREAFSKLKKFGEAYEGIGYDESQVNDEKLTELLALIGNGDIDLTKLPKSFTDTVIDFLNQIAKFLGIKARLTPTSDIGALRQVAKDIKNSFDKGVDIGEFLGYDNKGNIDAKDLFVNEDGTPFNQMSLSNKFVDLMNGVVFEYIEDTEDFNRLKSEGFITNDKKLSDYEGYFAVLHIPDNAFTGKAFKDNELILDGKGGVYFPIRFNDKGYFWASTSNAAKSLAKILNESRMMNPDGKIRMALISTEPKKILSSSNASTGVMEILFSKAFDKRAKLKESNVVDSYVEGVKLANIEFVSMFEKKIKEKIANIKKAKSDASRMKMQKNLSDFKKKGPTKAPKLTKSMSADDIKAILNEFFSPDNSSFREREVFNRIVLNLIAQKVNNIDKVASERSGKELRIVATEVLSFLGMTKNAVRLKSTGGRLSADNLVQGFSDFMMEPMLKGEDKNKVYAILEVDSEVEAVSIGKEHGSYDYAVKPIDKKAKITLNILQDRLYWKDNVIDPETNQPMNPKRASNVLPTYGVSPTPVKFAVSQMSLYTATIDGVDVELKGIDVDVVNGFYSPLEQEVFGSKQDKMPAKKWLDRFKGREEAKWTGLNDWLESQQGAVSKQDILDYMKENRIVISEVVMEKKSTGQKTADEYEDWLYDLSDEELLQEATSEGIEVNDIEKDREDWLIDELVFNYKNTYLKSGRIVTETDNTKYSQYQLEGEKENYREVLVTLPRQSNLDGISKELFNKKYDELNPSERVSVKRQARNQGDIVDESGVFRSTHFDEPNILVHLRMNERTDAEGNKVLFLEEVQSDWAQKGRREGFDLDKKQVEEKYNQAKSALSQIENKIENKYGKDWDLRGDIDEVLSKEDYENYRKATGERAKWGNLLGKEYKTGTPTAPFVMNTSDWVKLAMRVALKEAVKSGANSIAWTTGEQQNDRFDLSKSVDQIVVIKVTDNSFNVVGRKGGERLIEKTGIDRKELEATVGKDITEKAINGQEIFEGQDLKVGGKGMIGFYGTVTKSGIVGQVASKLFGQEVSTVEVNGVEQPSVTVTPQMKAEVRRGLPQMSLMNQAEVAKRLEGVSVSNISRTIDIEQTIPVEILNSIPRGETFQERLSPSYYKDLKEDIQKNGIKQPIIIKYYAKDNAVRLSEGHHRLKIAKELGIKDIPVQVNVVWGTSIKQGNEDIVGQKIVNPPINVAEVNNENYRKRDYFPSNIKVEELGYKNDAIASAYIQAKQDGSNPELVKAVEDAIGEPTTTVSKAQVAGIRPTTREDVEAALSRGDRVIATLEMDDEPIEITSMAMVDRIDLDTTVIIPDVKGKMKKAFPSGQMSIFAPRGMMNTSEVAKKQYPLHQALVQLGIDAYQNQGIRNYASFVTYAKQFDDEINKNPYMERVWDDVMRIVNGKKPLIQSEKDYRDFLVKQNNVPVANAERLKKRNRIDMVTKGKEKLLDSRAELFKALSQSANRLWSIAANYVNVIGGMGAKAIYTANTLADGVFKGLKTKKEYLIGDQMQSESDIFNNMLLRIRVLEIQRKMQDKFDEFMDLDQAYKVETDPAAKATLLEQRDNVKRYLDRNNMLVKDAAGNYSLGTYMFANNLNERTAFNELLQLQDAYPDLYEKLMQRADAYHMAFNTLLNMQLEAGLISQESYDEMVEYKYVPMRYIGYMIEEIVAGDDIKINSEQSKLIKRLKGGSEENIDMAFDEALKFQAYMVTRAIAKNNAMQKIYEAAKSENFQGPFYEPDVTGVDADGNFEYGNLPAGDAIIYFYMDGKKMALATSKEIASAFNGSNMPDLGMSDEALGWAMMTIPFRAVTTNLNPGFGLAQLILDIPQALLTNEAYSNITTGLPRILFRDLKLLTGKGLGELSKLLGIDMGFDKEWNELAMEAREYGGLITFTGMDNETMSITQAAEKAMDKKSNMLTNALAAYRDKVEQFGTTMETVTRLAVYRKMRNNLISEYKKANNGKAPTGEDLDNIRTQAAATSLNVLNYNRGGTLIKPLNKALAYLNVAFQVPYSIAQYAKKNPYQFSMKAMEVAAWPVVITMLGYLAMDDDDREKFLEIYNNYNEYEKANYWHILNPLWDGKDPETMIIRIKKPTILLPLVNSTEVGVMHSITGGKTVAPKDYVKKQLPSDMNAMQPIGWQLLSSAPSINALIKYFGNYDVYRKTEIVKNEKQIFDFREGQTDPNVGKFYKYVATKTGYFDENTGEYFESISPARMDAAVKSTLGNYETNISTAAPLMVVDYALSRISSDYANFKYPEQTDEVKSFMDKLWEGVGLKKRFFAKVPEVNPEIYKNMEDEKKKKNYFREEIRSRMDEIMNGNLSREQKREEIRSYYYSLKKTNPYYDAKDLERDLENAYKYVDNKNWLKDRPKWYRTFIFAPDTESKIMIFDVSTENMDREDKRQAFKDLYVKGFIKEGDDAWLKYVQKEFPKQGK